MLTGQELASKMAAQLKDTANFRIVSAYLTYPAIRWLHKHAENACVTIMGRFRPIDFLKGASNLSAVEAALDSGYEVYMLNTLHAKIYQLDDKSIFTGSANFTSKGLSLCSTPNQEVAVEIPCNFENIAFIDKLFRVATPINEDTFELMQQKLDVYLNESTHEDIENWGFDFIDNSNELFLSNLPICPPYIKCLEYKNNPELDFAKVFSSIGNLDSARKIFEKTKCYKWLCYNLETSFQEGIRFGELSKLLHDAIKDDPSPYRRQVKEIQVNLFEYIELLSFDKFELHQPGAKSQILKMKKW